MDSERYDSTDTGILDKTMHLLTEVLQKMLPCSNEYFEGLLEAAIYHFWGKSQMT